MNFDKIYDAAALIVEEVMPVCEKKNPEATAEISMNYEMGMISILDVMRQMIDIASEEIWDAEIEYCENATVEA